MSKKKWTEKDTSKETGDSIKKVNETFHKARNDAAEEGGWGIPKERHDKKEEKKEKEDKKKQK